MATKAKKGSKKTTDKKKTAKKIEEAAVEAEIVEEPKKSEPEQPTDTTAIVRGWKEQPLNLKSLDSFKQLEYMGQVFAGSKMFTDVAGYAGAMVKIMAGQELGITPFQSMTGIHLINGKPVMGAGLMSSQLKSSPKYDYDVEEDEGVSCAVTVYNIEGGKRRVLGKRTWTIEKAKKAGLVKPGSPWDKYPESMLFARAISSAIRTFAPDGLSIGSVYTPEEMGAEVGEDGEMVAPPRRRVENLAETETPATPDKPPAKPSAVEPEEGQVAELKAVFERKGFTEVPHKIQFIRTSIKKDMPENFADYTILINELNELPDMDEQASVESEEQTSMV